MNRLTSLITLSSATLLAVLLASGAASADTKTKTAKTAKSVATVVQNKQPKGLRFSGQAPNAQSKSIKTTKIKKSDKNSQHDNVWFDSIDITLYDDPNQNGYYNRLLVEFDADTYYSYIEVYAQLYLTDSNGIKDLYFVTDDFSLYGMAYSDRYEVDTLLTTNWIADGYDLSIELYDAYDHYLVAHVNSADADHLADLHLESVDFEYLPSHELSVFSSGTWLQSDLDGDGYYHSFNIELYIGNNYASSDVYGQVYISDDLNHWEPLYTSEDFVVHEDDTSAQVNWQFELQNGYPPGDYYLRVEIINVATHLTMLTLEPEDYNALYGLPLEDLSYEEQPVRDSVSHQSGGHFGGPVVLWLLSSLVWFRRRS